MAFKVTLHWHGPVLWALEEGQWRHATDEEHAAYLKEREAAYNTLKELLS